MASPDEEGAQRSPKRRRLLLKAPAGPQVARVGLNPADCTLGTRAHRARTTRGTLLLLVCRSRNPKILSSRCSPCLALLDFDVGGGRGLLQGQGLHDGGFAYCWSGARATVGVRGGGKYCFGCKIVAKQDVVIEEDTAADQWHICRVGLSMGDEPVGALGETGRSFGIEGTGKFFHQGKHEEHGLKFGIGDTVVCAVDLDSKPMASIGLSKNGVWFGIIKQFDASDKGLGLLGPRVRRLQWESAIFPHILLKNVVVKMQFSRDDGLEPVDGYEPWSSAYAGGNAVVGPVFEEQGTCHVVMMVGLPASGKSTWVEKWTKKHKAMRYTVLGSIPEIDQKIAHLHETPTSMCTTRYVERMQRFMDWCTSMFDTLLARAAKIPRNYIIDQTNLDRKTRIDKLVPFANHRKVATVVFPSPSVLKARAAKQFKEKWKCVPAYRVNQMTAEFVLPGLDELLDEVAFVELPRDEAKRNLDEMKRLMPRASPSYANILADLNAAISTAAAGTISPAVSTTIALSLSGLDPQIQHGTVSPAVSTTLALSLSGLDPQIQHGTVSPAVSTTIALSLSGLDPQIQYAAGTSQHQIQPSYPSNPSQHQIQSSNLSNPNQGEHSAGLQTSAPAMNQINQTPASNQTIWPPWLSTLNQMNQPLASNQTNQAPTSNQTIWSHWLPAPNQTNQALASNQTIWSHWLPAPNQTNQAPASNQTIWSYWLPAPNQTNQPLRPNQTNQAPTPDQMNQPLTLDQTPNQTNRPHIPK
ncbi:hypothetical protein GUJ93_ZPchr0004g39736 [Zizania palustris]|uniref:SPRY domain-containing protein n=1 Tax=Zizania palustris TaxID=103762 RepID=A0A8J5S7J3_ZIZPA|nr:hypothetical protein GUJ93_ZPchr0004g39736 [Zizania palustris]